MHCFFNEMCWVQTCLEIILSSISFNINFQCTKSVAVDYGMQISPDLLKRPLSEGDAFIHSFVYLLHHTDLRQGTNSNLILKESLSKPNSFCLVCKNNSGKCFFWEMLSHILWSGFIWKNAMGEIVPLSTVVISAVDTWLSVWSAKGSFFDNLL